MNVNIHEQETTVNIMRDSDKAEIYTSDSTMMTRLDKLASDPDSPSWELIEEIRSGGEIVAKRYRTDKRLVSFRSSVVTRNLTDEQRQAMAERLQKAAAEWRRGKNECD